MPCWTPDGGGVGLVIYSATVPEATFQTQKMQEPQLPSFAEGSELWYLASLLWWRRRCLSRIRPEKESRRRALNSPPASGYGWCTSVSAPGAGTANSGSAASRRRLASTARSPFHSSSASCSRRSSVRCGHSVTASVLGVWSTVTLIRSDTLHEALPMNSSR